MNMNSVNVHTTNKTLPVKQGSLLLAGVLMSSLLTACGGSSGPSVEELAAQAAAAAQAATDKAAAQAAADKAVAQAAADQAAATAAAQAAAAQLVADQQAALVAARQQVSDTASLVETEVKAAQSASASAGALAVQAGQQASTYAELAASLKTTQSYAEQAKTEASRAVAQQVIVTKAKTDAEKSQDIEAVTALEKQAEGAVTVAKQARIAAEKALASTRTAAQTLSDAIKAAEASKHYTKLDANGQELPSSATSWSCVKDKTTGLVWEEKTNDGGVRDKNWRYRHLHNSGGYAGTVDYNGQTLCKGGLGSCDPYSYINVVNSQSLCGSTSWRLPLKGEFGGIAQINAGGTPPHIDQAFFPDVVNKPYEAAYCTENMNTPRDCGYTDIVVNPNDNTRTECNYQGVDFGLPLLNGIQTKENLENSILVPLRYYGEVKDGKPLWPNANWVCYTRLVSSR